MALELTPQASDDKPFLLVGTLLVVFFYYAFIQSYRRIDSNSWVPLLEWT